MRELHGELTTAGGHGTEVTDVTKHLAEGHFRFDADPSSTGFLTFDHAATTVEVTNYIPNVIIGGKDIHLHDRFEDLGASFG